MTFLIETALVVLVLLALAALVFKWRRAPQYGPLSPPLTLAEDPAADLFTWREGERPTEDDIAQARLGGPRGARELKPAPMVPQVEKNTSFPIDPGHNT